MFSIHIFPSLLVCDWSENVFGSVNQHLTGVTSVNVCVKRPVESDREDNQCLMATNDI